MGEMSQSFVLTGTKAYYVGEPRQISSGELQWRTCSPKGRYVVFTEVPIGGRLGPRFEAMILGKPQVPVVPRLMVWDARSGASKEVTGLPAKSMAVIDQTAWSADGQSALFVVHVPSSDPDAQGEIAEQVFRVDLAQARAQAVTQPLKPGDFNLRVIASPTKPIYVVTYQSIIETTQGRPRSKSVMSAYDGNGKPLKNAEFEAPGMLFPSEQWTADGNYVLVKQVSRSRFEPQQKETTYVFDPLRGTSTPTKETFALYKPEEPDQELQLTFGSALAKAAKETWNGGSLWVYSPSAKEQGICLVAVEADPGAEILADKTDIVFSVRTRLYACELSAVDKQVYLRAKTAAERTAALNEVKQIGTALHIFAADSNDRFPDPSSFRDSVLPYCRNEKLLDGFVYTFKGGSLLNVENPSGTEVGYKNVQGGRAVVYADGSARFVPDK